MHRRAQTVGGGIKPCQWLKDAAPPVSIGQSPLPWSRVARLYLPADLIFLRQCDLRHPSRESCRHHRPKRPLNVGSVGGTFQAAPMPSEPPRLKPLVRSTTPSFN